MNVRQNWEEYRNHTETPNQTASYTVWWLKNWIGWILFVCLSVTLIATYEIVLLPIKTYHKIRG